MTTATLETFTLQSTLDAPPAAEGSDMIVRDLKVFRVGTFRDSRGRQKTWTAEALQQAVDNFNALRRSRVFPHVPVRLDHTQSIQSVVGYFHEMRFDGTFLRADVLFTKKDAYADYEGGHLRNVSLEIGQYRTNDEVVYDNVVQGLAFVDIPAVEGLHQREPGDIFTMSTTTTDPKAPETGAPAAATPETGPGNPPTPTPTPAPAPAQPAPATEPEAPAQHARQAVHTFRVNGADVTDPVVTQAHIDALEKFRSDTMTSIREGFVEDLFKAGKIVAAQKDALTQHVGTLSAEQFAAFRSIYDAMPGNNLFAKHETNTNGDPAANVTDAAEEVTIAREVIATWRRQGKDDTFIHRQPQWATVQAADAAGK